MQLFTRNKDNPEFQGYNFEANKITGLTSQGYKLAAAIVLAIVLAIPFFGSIKTISPGQAAVSTRFGTLNGIRNEGIYLAIFEGYTLYDLKAKQVVARHAAGSKDGQYIYVDTAFTYSLQSGKLTDLYSQVGTQIELEAKFINPVLQDVVYQLASQFSAAEILPKRAEFRGMVIETLKERLNQNYFNFIDLQITDIDFSPEYNASLEQKQIAEQNAIRDRQVAEQNNEKAKVELETVKIQAQKDIEAAKGNSEAQRLLQQSLTTELIQKMWIEKWDGKLPTTSAGANSSFYLPAK